MYAVWLCDTLTSLADAIGARRLSYPEGGQREVYSRQISFSTRSKKQWGGRWSFPILTPANSVLRPAAF